MGLELLLTDKITASYELSLPSTCDVNIALYLPVETKICNIYIPIHVVEDFFVVETD